MRYRRRRRISNHGSGVNPIQLLALSMFIMLLAFFIVLNSVSSFNEDKIHPIMGSIEKTFSTRMEKMVGQLPSISPEEDDLKDLGQGRYPGLRRLENIFRGLITGDNMETDYEKNTMWVRISYERLNSVILRASSPSGTPLPPAYSVDGRTEDNFLATLVSLMATTSQDQAYRMDMLLNVEENPAIVKIGQPAVFQRERNKIGKLSRMLEQAGVPVVQLSIGLQEGKKNMVDVIFRASYPHDALKNMEDFPVLNNRNIPAGGVM